MKVFTRMRSSYHNHIHNQNNLSNNQKQWEGFNTLTPEAGGGPVRSVVLTFLFNPFPVTCT